MRPSSISRQPIFELRVDGLDAIERTESPWRGFGGMIRIHGHDCLEQSGGHPRRKSAHRERAIGHFRHVVRFERSPIALASGDCGVEGNAEEVCVALDGVDVHQVGEIRRAQLEGARSVILVARRDVVGDRVDELDADVGLFLGARVSRWHRCVGCGLDGMFRSAISPPQSELSSNPCLGT